MIAGFQTPSYLLSHTPLILDRLSALHSVAAASASLTSWSCRSCDTVIRYP